MELNNDLEEALLLEAVDNKEELMVNFSAYILSIELRENKTKIDSDVKNMWYVVIKYPSLVKGVSLWADMFLDSIGNEREDLVTLTDTLMKDIQDHIKYEELT